MYVGRTSNLRSRMGSHLNPATAHNEHVANLRDRSSLEFWCNLMPVDETAMAEKMLIRSVDPLANKIRYAKEIANEH